jgi:hypothetical protein
MSETPPNNVFPNTNFTASHSVIIDRPLSVVFPIIGTAEGHDRVVRLSKLCTDSQLQQRDTITIPRGTTLATQQVRTLPAADPTEQAFANVISLPRQHFTLTEGITVAFLPVKKVELTGTLTWDEANKIALYETVSGGITVWKLRKFTEMSDGKTKVHETIEGHCAGWMKSIVQGQTRKGHTEHMESYHTLFES